MNGVGNNGSTQQNGGGSSALAPPVLPGVTLDLLSVKGADLLDLAWKGGQLIDLEVPPEVALSQAQLNAPPAVVHDPQVQAMEQTAAAANGVRSTPPMEAAIAAANMAVPSAMPFASFMPGMFAVAPAGNGSAMSPPPSTANGQQQDLLRMLLIYGAVLGGLYFLTRE